MASSICLRASCDIGLVRCRRSGRRTRGCRHGWTPPLRLARLRAERDAVAAVAQEVFKDALRDLVAPVLREHGFRGSGQSYWLPDDTNWAQVGLQKSTASSSTELRFTVNLMVTDKARWDEVRREHSYVKDTPPPAVNRISATGIASASHSRTSRRSQARPVAAASGSGTSSRPSTEITGGKSRLTTQLP